jgi:hypothetical protein
MPHLLVIDWNMYIVLVKANNRQFPRFIPTPYTGSSIRNGKIGVGKSLASCMYTHKFHSSFILILRNEWEMLYCATHCPHKLKECMKNGITMKLILFCWIQIIFYPISCPLELTRKRRIEKLKPALLIAQCIHCHSLKISQKSVTKEQNQHNK